MRPRRNGKRPMTHRRDERASWPSSRESTASGTWRISALMRQPTERFTSGRRQQTIRCRIRPPLRAARTVGHGGPGDPHHCGGGGPAGRGLRVCALRGPRAGGVSVDEAEFQAGMLHHQYPCLAGMVKDPDFNDTLMHVSGHMPTRGGNGGSACLKMRCAGRGEGVNARQGAVAPPHGCE